MEQIRINIAKEISKPSAVLHSDGLLLYNKINSIKEGEIILSFEGITHCTTAFLNASIGKFLIDNPNSILKFEDVSKETHIMDKISLVTENALSEKKRNNLDDSSRNLFYA